MDAVTLEKKVKRSLKYSIFDGAFYSAMVGFGESFLSAFAIFLKATSTQIGILGSLPQALGSLAQFFSNSLIKLFRSRKRFVVISALLEGLMYIPIALVFFLGQFKVLYLILFVCIYWVFGTILTPAWSSWMGDLVREEQRGSYFGRRNRIAGLTSLVTLLAAGYILQHYAKSNQYLGFVIIFSLALVARIFSFTYLMKKYEPSFKIAHEAEFTFVDFLKQAWYRNYGVFVIYMSVMNFAVFVASPFFAAYMLYDLKMSYMVFTLVSGISLLAKYVSMPYWGRISDRYGTKTVLTVSGFLMPIVPLLWFFSREIWYLALIQVYSGIVWAGFEISSFAFIFDSTSAEKRPTCVAYFNIVNGIAIFAGAMVGSLIVNYNHIYWSKYLLVFIISCILRYLASLLLIPKIREVRHVQHISYEKLFYRIITTMPTMGAMHHLIAFKKREKDPFYKEDN